MERASPRLEDIYLERRREVRVTDRGGGRQVADGTVEGVAVRYRLPSRTELLAVNSLNPQGVADLLTRHGAPFTPPTFRPVPAAELDPPRGFRERALELLDHMNRQSSSVTYLVRQAAVVRPEGWTAIGSPPLLRIHSGEQPERALLAVWGHPKLPAWIAELLAPPPARPWLPPSGLRGPVLFGAGTAGVLVHELLGHMLEAEHVTSGAAPLASLQGAPITPCSLSLFDDPTRLDLPGGFTADDEGVVAQPLQLISKGVLFGWLCDRQAARLNNAAPGRGRRSSWRHLPQPRLSNLVVPAGSVSAEAIERDLRLGLTITAVSAAAVDPVSARAVIWVERGFEIRHGRRRRPLAPFALTGSVLEVLANLDPNLGNEAVPSYRLAWCVKGGAPLPTGALTPALLAHRLEVL